VLSVMMIGATLPHPLTRRSLLVGSGIGAFVGPMGSPAEAAGPSGPTGTGIQYAYVGSRTLKARNARGAGITVWRIDRAGQWELLQTVPAEDGDDTTPPPANGIPSNPSFLALSSDRRHLYTVHGNSTLVSAFAVDPSTRQLTLLNTVDTERVNPVHLSIDPTGRWLVVAYLAVPGSVASLPISESGALGPVTGVLDLPGTPGPHKTEQLGSNPHHAPFDPTGRWLVVPDRGLDRIFVATCDPATGRLALNEPGWVQTRELEGPRHIAFHPTRPLAYLASELRSTVTTYRWNGATGTLTPLQVLASTPPSMISDSRVGEITVAPSGRYVYVSNRSGTGDTSPGGPDSDTIGVYRVDSRTGTLTPTQWVSTEGIRPRFFGLDSTGGWLYAANEVTDTIVGYSLSDAGGRLDSHGVVARTGSPVSMVFSR
jgi:6-phosphogluconolactonase